MKKDDIYDEFLTIVDVRKHTSAVLRSSLTEPPQREYSRTFPELKGEDVELCLPKHEIPDEGLEDYTSCKA